MHYSFLKKKEFNSFEMVACGKWRSAFTGSLGRTFGGRYLFGGDGSAEKVKMAGRKSRGWQIETMTMTGRRDGDDAP